MTAAPDDVGAAGAADAGPVRSELAGDAAFAPLLASYVASMPAKRAALAAALAAPPGEVGPLRELAHQLKGSAGGYGFPGLSAAAAAVVAACREGREPDARRTGEELAGLLARVA